MFGLFALDIDIHSGFPDEQIGNKSKLIQHIFFQNFFSRV